MHASHGSPHVHENPCVCAACGPAVQECANPSHEIVMRSSQAAIGSASPGGAGIRLWRPKGRNESAARKETGGQLRLRLRYCVRCRRDASSGCPGPWTRRVSPSGCLAAVIWNVTYGTSSHWWYLNSSFSAEKAILPRVPVHLRLSSALVIASGSLEPPERIASATMSRLSALCSSTLLGSFPVLAL